MRPRPLYYFDRHLVIWRDDSGEAHVQDAFCPHLGAHLGHGGVVEGCEIRCPFHGWKFNAEGTNTDIPYADRTNQKGRINTYPVVERNGAVLAWYHPQGADPMWEVPQFPEFQGDADFAPITQRTFTIDAAWQELAENGVDSAHFRYVHNTAEVPELEKYETEGYRRHDALLAEVPHPPGRGRGSHRRRHLRARPHASPTSAASSTRSSWAATPPSRPRSASCASASR